MLVINTSMGLFVLINPPMGNPVRVRAGSPLVDHQPLSGETLGGGWNWPPEQGHLNRWAVRSHLDVHLYVTPSTEPRPPGGPAWGGGAGGLRTLPARAFHRRDQSRAQPLAFRTGGRNSADLEVLFSVSQTRVCVSVPVCVCQCVSV